MSGLYDLDWIAIAATTLFAAALGAARCWPALLGDRKLDLTQTRARARDLVRLWTLDLGSSR